MARYVGIDLGTTNSVVAVMDGPRARILDNREGQPQSRSIVGLKRRRKDGQETQEILVGEPALANWGLAVPDTIVSIKRLMGRGVVDPEVQKVLQWAQFEIREPSDGTQDSVRVVLGGQERSPVEVSAMILRKLKEDAEYRLGDEVTHAVITVPAYFSHIQKAATRKAGEQAGLRVIKILDEPTAAAVAFGLDSEDAEARTVLVYDLGGGTFDISILVMAGGTFAPLNLEGDMWLGGDNFDQALVERAVAFARVEHGIDATERPRFMVDLRKACQRAKETLSSSSAADLIVPGLVDGRGDLADLVMEVTREEFEDLVRPLVHRTVELVEKALRNANLTAEDVDAVLMAGNATNMPLVQRSMEELFGAEKVMRSIHPKHAVAIGAAIVAAVMGGRIVCGAPDPDDAGRECGHVNEPDAERCARCDSPLGPAEPGADVAGSLLRSVGGIAPFSYMVQSRVKGRGDVLIEFVKKGDTYPSESPRMHVFGTPRPGARIISFPILGGDDLESPDGNERQGEAFAILPPGLPAATPIRVTLWLDGDGVFKLSARLENGEDLHPWVVEKGEAQDRAVQTLVRVERLLGELAIVTGRQQFAELDETREAVFDAMRREDFPEALRLAEELEAAAGRVGVGETAEAMRQRGRNLIENSEFVVETYGWAFEAGQAEAVRGLVERTRSALSDDDQETLQRGMDELVDTLGRLPDTVTGLLAIRGVIGMRIQPYDPAAANRLGRELGEVEEALQREDEAVVPRLGALLEEISETMRGIPELAAGTPCSRGHPVPAGERWCPICREDTWLGLAAS